MHTITINGQLLRTSMSVDHKVNLIRYIMEIDVRGSLSSLDCIVLYVQMTFDRDVNVISYNIC